MSHLPGAGRARSSLVALLLLASSSCSEPSSVEYRAPSPPLGAPLAAEVNPFIGTSGETPNDGQTFPGAVVPWGMASPSPHTDLTTPVDAVNGFFASSGYRHGAPSIRGFGLTHLSGVGCPDLGLPVVAPVEGEPPITADDYASTYRNEVAYAGYYAAEMGEHGMVAEMTATPRTGVLRFWFPAGAPAHIVIDPAHGVSWVRNAGELSKVTIQEIAGSAGFGRFCAIAGGGRLYFAARLDRAADRVGLADPEAAPGESMALWSFDQAPQTPVTMWVGLSWVSIEEARANLEVEQLSFEEARDAGAFAWQRQLGRIEVSGGTDADRARFYTALYHALIHPSILQDVSGTYPKFSSNEIGRVRDGARYTVFSLWDTYRSLHPLLTLVYPETQLELLRSMEDMLITAGAPPKWELIGDEVQMMVGDPAAIVFADSYAKGLTDFDADTVYGVLRSSADRPAHRPGVAEYLELGFVSMESATTIWGPVSTTLEYALSDWSLAQLARMLGFDREIPQLLERASSYAGFYDGETGTLRPRNRDGSFLEPFDPDAIEGSFSFRLGGPGYVEGTAWHYAFFAPHDVDGLIALHGDQTFVDRLQWVFDTDRFVIWNEPDMGYPYLFTFVEGEEKRTQRAVRSVMERYFGADPAGLPGNDDAGALSAWFVFSAMGFYPVTPGRAEYRLGSPLFEKVTIHLSESHHEGQTFVIDAPGNSAANVFITEATLDGRPLEGSVLTHRSITSGGELRLQMSDTPN